VERSGIPLVTRAGLAWEERVMSANHRGTHYTLWFVVFGLIPLLGALTNHTALTQASGATSTSANYIEAAWLIGAGVLGLLVGNKNINGGKLAQPYDVLVGIIFTVAGVIGLLADFNLGTGGVTKYVNDAGILLGTLYPVLYTYLGIRSLHHGLSKNA
jgi:hypothetical protein